MQSSSDMILTLVFLGLAIFVIIKLRSILGQKTGFERPPEVIRREMEARNQPQQTGDNVVPLPMAGRQPPQQADIGARDAGPPPYRWQGLAEPGTPLANGLDAIAQADPSFDAREFGQGARGAYEMIVQAFARGDRKTLKDFLAKDVFDGFAGAIADRESRSETAEATFVSIDKSAIVEAEMRGKLAYVTVSFASKLINVTRDKAGAVVDGNAEKVVDVNDIWTFSRDVTSRDPNWRLVGTESGQ
jgi:predicted lipid-binding transport protein (Tim44 family)